MQRKVGEKIFIGDNVCVTVVDADGGKVRLGIEAPRDVPIYREELLPAAELHRRAEAAKARAAGTVASTSASTSPSPPAGAKP